MSQELGHLKHQPTRALLRVAKATQDIPLLFRKDLPE